MDTNSPRLLRETAEIALSEIKRFLEPRLMEKFNLRRVSAPLYLPAGSPLLVEECRGVRVTLPSVGEVEIVASLDSWLRSQLALYDIAPGFGVYTIMNALRPGESETESTSPHVAAWCWQQSVASDAELTDALLTSHAKAVYALLVDTEKMILSIFPHLTRALPEHPDIEITDSTPYCSHRSATIYAWNKLTSQRLRLAEISLFPATDIAPASVGGTIYRSRVAMQLLHLNQLL